LILCVLFFIILLCYWSQGVVTFTIILHIFVGNCESGIVHFCESSPHTDFSVFTNFPQWLTQNFLNVTSVWAVLHISLHYWQYSQFLLHSNL